MWAIVLLNKIDRALSVSSMCRVEGLSMDGERGSPGRYCEIRWRVCQFPGVRHGGARIATIKQARCQSTLGLAPRALLDSLLLRGLGRDR